MQLTLDTLDGSEKQKLQRLFSHIQEYYRRGNSESRLDNLTSGMVRKGPPTVPN